MKKFMLILAMTLSLAACGTKTPSPDDVDKVGKGMNEDKVVEILGEPSVRTTDRKEIDKKYTAVSTVIASNTDTYSDLSIITDAINNKESVEVFDYDTDEKDTHIIIYFVDGKASYFYSVDYKK